MNISYLIQILQNKITVLTNAKSQAVSIGDLEQINAIDKDLLDTQNTFSQLVMLADINQAAASANSTPAAVIATGLDSIQNVTPSVQGPSAEAIVNGYDISAYATDPLHEQKIQNIVNAMNPSMSSVSEIDTYIQGVAPSSPVQGYMVVISADKYSVNIPLLLAIMQNDSSFGTQGIGARTFNPGNVGNTGFAERTFASWDEGVDAVAQWLDKHRLHPLPASATTASLQEIVPESSSEAVDPNAVEFPPITPPTPPSTPAAPITTPSPAPQPAPEAPSSSPAVTSAPNASSASEGQANPATTPDPAPLTETAATSTQAITPEPAANVTPTQAENPPSDPIPTPTAEATSTQPVSN